jgi:hypothetical protein
MSQLQEIQGRLKLVLSTVEDNVSSLTRLPCITKHVTMTSHGPLVRLATRTSQCVATLVG